MVPNFTMLWSDTASIKTGGYKLRHKGCYCKNQLDRWLLRGRPISPCSDVWWRHWELVGSGGYLSDHVVTQRICSKVFQTKKGQQWITHSSLASTMYTTKDTRTSSAKSNDPTSWQKKYTLKIWKLLVIWSTNAILKVWPTNRRAPSKGSKNQKQAKDFLSPPTNPWRWQ